MRMIATNPDTFFIDKTSRRAKMPIVNPVPARPAHNQREGLPTK